MKKYLIVSLALLSLLALAGCGGSEAPAEYTPPAGVAVQVSTVERRDVATENRVSGSVTSDDETSIYVAATAKCIAVYVEEGETVEAGKIICKIDLGSTLASYNAARISYDSSAASYAQQEELFDQQIAMTEQKIKLYEQTLSLREKSIAMQQTQFENTKALFAIGAASQLEVDTQELQLEQAKAELDQAKVELEGLRLQILSTQAQRDSTLAQLEAGMENTRANLEQLNLIMDDVDASGNVIAPASGTITSLSAVEGGFVSANYPVAVISGAEQMKITVYISEALLPKLAVGDAALVSVGSAGVEFTGVIRSLEHTANMQTKLYTVELSVPSDVEGLVAGMFADVTFFTETSAGALAIPSEAILTANGEEYVYLVKGDKAVRTAVTTGLIGDGVTEVLTGLASEEQLVVVGQQYLSDGDVVRVVDGG